MVKGKREGFIKIYLGVEVEVEAVSEGDVEVEHCHVCDWEM